MVCVNGTANYNYTGPSNKIRWSISGGGTIIGSITANNISINWTQTGSHTVYLSDLLDPIGNCEVNVTVTTVSGGTATAAQSTVCYGGGTTISLSGNMGAVVRWEKSESGGAWQNVTHTATSYNATGIQVTTSFRALITYCSSQIYSSVATVSPLLPLNSGSLTSPGTICYNTAPPLLGTVTATGSTGSFSYQWQKRAPGGSWSNISGATSQTYQSGALTQSTEFRRGVVGGCSEPVQYTNAITVTVREALSPGTISGGSTICYNAAPSQFTGTSASGSTGTYSFQWQRRSPGGTWSNISGATGASYSSGTLVATTEFRRGVTSGCSESMVFSNTIVVQVHPALQQLQDSPANQAVCSGSVPSTLTPPAPSGGNGSYTFEWEQSSNGTSWVSASGTRNGSSYSPAALTVTTYYRRKVTSCGAIAYSGTIQVTVSSLSVAGSLGANIESYGPASGSLSLTGYTGTIQKWRRRVGTGSWADLAHTQPTYNYTNINTTTSFEVVVKNGACAQVSTSPITITIHSKPSIEVIGSSILGPGGSTLLRCEPNFLEYRWKRNGQFLSGEINKSLVVTSPGSYTVVVKATATSPEFESTAVTITSALDEQSSNHNYVRTFTYNKKGVNESTDDFALEGHQMSIATTYFDDLGRPLQTVTLGAGGNGGDLIQPVVLDAFGRESKKYLPYTSDYRYGGFYSNAESDQLAFYQTGTQSISPDTHPYSEVIFESSPLNRPIKQYGPGDEWSSEGGDKYILNSYLTNRHGTGTGMERIIAWKVNTIGGLERLSAVTNYIESGGYFSNGQLSITVTTDEQGHQVREYSDKQGRVILKKVQAIENALVQNDTHWAQTYYIYDDFGNLVMVLPPEAVKALIEQ
jgi:hypothetical protein